MMATRSVSVKVSGGDQLGKRLVALANRMSTARLVRVGFLEGATYPAAAARQLAAGKKTSAKKRARLVETAGGKSLSVAQVAFWNNFGTIRSHPRPFFSDTIREGRETWGSKMAKIAKATGGDGERILTLMGEHIKDQIVKHIKDWPADNRPRTVARKGFNKGLIDQGIMQRNVDYQVVK